MQLGSLAKRMASQFYLSFRYWGNSSPVRWALILFFMGISVGVANLIFLVGLEEVTRFRQSHAWIILFLPLAGVLFAFFYKRLQGDESDGVGSIIHEIHRARKPLKGTRIGTQLLGTWWTHLFGGSAGREGTSVQLGAVIADQFSQRFFPLTAVQRKILLIAGAGAGFGCAVGAPWAGAVFGLEFAYLVGLRFAGWFESLIVSWLAFFIVHLFVRPQWEVPAIPHLVWSDILGLLLVALAFGVLARLCIWTLFEAEKYLAKIFPSLRLRLFVGSCLVLFFYLWVGYEPYAGLGKEYIHQFLKGEKASSLEFVWQKWTATLLTVGSGFKGGEFVPLVYLGTSFGAWMRSWMLEHSYWQEAFLNLLPYLGFGAIFGAASRTPLACTVMIAELFGWKLGALALFVNLIAAIVAGVRLQKKTELAASIYKNQM